MSKELGEKLLQGWTMLADCCPKSGCYTPLVERKKDNTILCVTCNTYFRRQDKEMIPINTDSDAKPTTNAAITKQTVASITNNNNAASKTQFSDADEEDYEMLEETNAIDQMLGGWTVLPYKCPGCTVPLLKNPKGEMWCPSCNTQVLTKSEFDPSKHKIVSGPLSQHVQATSSPTSQSTQAPPPVPSRPAPKTETHAESQPTTPKPQLSVSPVFNSNVAIPQTQPQTASQLHRGTTAPVQVVGSAKAALYQKIEECTQMLRSTQDINTCIDLAKMISQCADALTALNNIPEVSSSLRH